MSTGPRQKLCAVCGKDWRTMYRIKYKEGADWVFACKQCLLEVKKRNPHYKYGGTWKRWKYQIIYDRQLAIRKPIIMTKATIKGPLFMLQI